MDSSSLSPSPLERFDRAGNLPHITNGSIPQRPRLRSPHLFRDIFAEGHDPRPRHAINLPPLHSQETLRDVRDALHRADMAVRNAQEAFRNRRPASGPSSVVDLTGASPETSTDGFFLSHHPDDRRQHISAIRSAAHPLHEPVYGIDSASIRAYHPPRMPPLHDFMTSRARRERSDEEAVERQRQAHRNWERNLRYRERRLQESTQPDLRQQHQPDPSDDEEESTSEDYSSPSAPTTPGSDAMDPVDLTRVDDNSTLQAVLSKQRQDAIASQNSASSASKADSGTPRSALSGYKCAICMDTPTDATTTVCGHLFCHKCIVDSVKWSIQQIRNNPDGRHLRAKNGTCPVCRKSLNTMDSISKKARSLIPLEIKRVPRAWYDSARSKGKKRVRDAHSEEDDVPADVDLLSPKKITTDPSRTSSGKRPKVETMDEELFGEWIENPV